MPAGAKIESESEVHSTDPASGGAYSAAAPTTSEHGGWLRAHRALVVAGGALAAVGIGLYVFGPKLLPRIQRLWSRGTVASETAARAERTLGASARPGTRRLRVPEVQDPPTMPEARLTAPSTEPGPNNLIKTMKPGEWQSFKQQLRGRQAAGLGKRGKVLKQAKPTRTTKVEGAAQTRRAAELKRAALTARPLELVPEIKATKSTKSVRRPKSGAPDPARVARLNKSRVGARAGADHRAGGRSVAARSGRLPAALSAEKKTAVLQDLMANFDVPRTGSDLPSDVYLRRAAAGKLEPKHLEYLRQYFADGRSGALIKAQNSGALSTAELRVLLGA